MCSVSMAKNAWRKRTPTDAPELAIKLAPKRGNKGWQFSLTTFADNSTVVITDLTNDDLVKIRSGTPAATASSSTDMPTTDSGSTCVVPSPVGAPTQHVAAEPSTPVLAPGSSTPVLAPAQSTGKTCQKKKVVDAQVRFQETLMCWHQWAANPSTSSARKTGTDCAASMWVADKSCRCASMPSTARSWRAYG